MKGTGLQNTGHPVRFIVLFFDPFDGVAAGLIPGQHDIEHVAIDARDHRGRLGATGYRSGKTVGDGLLPFRAAGLDGLDDLLVLHQFDFALQYVDVNLVGIAFLEQIVSGLDFLGRDFFDQILRIFGIQGIDRRKRLNLLGINLETHVLS